MNENVEQDRGEGRNLELAPGIQNAACQRHEGHEADVRKHDAGHDHRSIEGLLIVFQTGGDGVDDEWRGQNANHAGHQHDPGQYRGDMIDQMFGGGFALLVFVFGQNRHEGLGERAFGKQAAQQIGNAEGHIECIGVCGSAKCACKQNLPGQSCNTGEHRHARDGGKRFMQVHGAAL